MSLTGGLVWPHSPPTQYLYWPFISLIQYFWLMKCTSWARGGIDGSFFFSFFFWKCFWFMAVLSYFVINQAITALYRTWPRKNVLEKDVSPSARAVSVPSLSVVTSCTVQLLSGSCSEAGWDVLHQNHRSAEFGNRPRLVAAAHVEGRKSTFLSCSFTQRKVGAFLCV